MLRVIDHVSARDFLPRRKDLSSLRKASLVCQGCPLYKSATQTVFGEGPADARIVLVGEQPGNDEDRVGRPFVGPAGRLLDRMLEEVGLDRSKLYVTNAVKHFKFQTRGKRRLHSKPKRSEVVACRAWLESELAAIEPEVLVCMGATAATDVFGPSFALTRHRGEVLESDLCPQTVVTLHPSAILRAIDDPRTVENRQSIVDDLKLAKRLAGL